MRSCWAGALPFRSTCGGKKFCSQICVPVVLSGVQLLVDRVGDLRRVEAVVGRRRAGRLVPDVEHLGRVEEARKSAASFWCFDHEVTKYDVDWVAL